MSKLKTQNTLGGRTWFNLCLFGFIGQIAWNLENMYFNTFLYNTVYEGGTVTQGLSSMKAIKLMVALSALTAVLTTFLMGNLSDKVGKRKIFISGGYVVWGITVLAFGFITKDNVGTLFGIDKGSIGAVVTATSVTVIAMDCIMTFIGSTGNDSAFNAWVTDITDTSNRATVESVLAILPVAATVIVVILGGFIETIGYKMFFVLLGSLVVLSGLIGIFTIKETGKKSENDEDYFKNLVYGFRPSVIKKNSRLYLALLAMCFYCVAVQVWFPYLLIYLEHSLNFKIEDLIGYLSLPVILIAAAVLAVTVGFIIVMGKVIDKIGKDILIFVALGCFVVGLVLAYFSKKLLFFGLSAIPLLIGYGFLGIMLNATIRDHTPEDKVGLFQGIRMIFFVLIPMVAGPAIGDFVCEKSAMGQYINEVGESTYEPCSAMFLAGAIVGALTLIPVVMLKKKGFKAVEKEKE